MASERRPALLCDEAFGLVIGGLSLFILLSLLSWSHAASTLGGVSPSANWGGPVGHRLASMLIQALGGGAFLVVGLLGHAAHLWYTCARRRQLLALGLGGILLLLGTRTSAAIQSGADFRIYGRCGGSGRTQARGCSLAVLQCRGHPVDQRHRGRTGWHDGGPPVVVNGPAWDDAATIVRQFGALIPPRTARAQAGIHSPAAKRTVTVIPPPWWWHRCSPLTPRIAPTSS